MSLGHTRDVEGMTKYILESGLYPSLLGASCFNSYLYGLEVWVK